jgi:hypothetical protein
MLQKSFCRRCRISDGRWRVTGVMIGGTSSPCAKFVGDFGSATETMRIIDLFALQVFAKNWTAATFDFCNTICHKPTSPVARTTKGAANRDSLTSITLGF